MDFSLSSDQRLLKDSLERFVRADYDFATRRAASATDEGFDRATWARFAELGWLAATLPEDFGGLGGGAAETMVLMEGLGRGLAVEPIVPSVVLGGGLIALGGSADHKSELLPALAEGRLLLAFAYAEPTSRFDLHDVTVSARRDGDGVVIDGAKCVVMAGGSADKVIVSARTSGERRDTGGISLFLVDRGVEGLSVRDYPTVDGLRAAEFGFENVRVPADALLGEWDAGLPLIERVVDRATAAICAEALGIMAVLNEATVEYSKTRVQFEQPIGKFQALQHRMVDMFIAYEETKSLVYLAAIKADDEDPVERAKAVSAAKVLVGEAGRLIGQEAVQIHGAIAMTDEYYVGHYFKRLSMIDRQFGDTDHHLKRFGML